MLYILSIILLLIIICIPIYIFFARSMSSNHEAQHVQAMAPVEVSTVNNKKNKKQKKSIMKNMNQEISNKTNDDDDIYENSKQTNIDKTTVNKAINEYSTENEDVESIIQPQEASAMLATPDIKKVTSNNKKSLKSDVDEFKLLNTKLEEANEEISKFKNDIDNITEENRFLKNSMKELECSKDKTEQQLLQQIKSEKANASNRITKLERKYEKKEIEYKEKFESLMKQLQTSEFGLISEQKKSANLQTEKEQVLSKYQEVIANLKIENKDMQRKHENQIETFKAERIQVELEKNRLSSALIEKDGQVTKLSNELKQLSILMDKISKEKLHLTKCIDQMSDELKEKESHISSLEFNKTNLSDVIENLRSEINKKSDEYELRLLKVTEESDKKQWAINDLQRENSGFKNEIDFLEQKIVYKNEELNEKLSDMSILLNTKNSDFESLGQEKAILMSENEEIKRTLFNKESEFDQRMLDLSKKISDLHNDMLELERHKVELLKTIETLHENIKERDDKIKQQAKDSEKITKMDTYINELVKENESLLKKIIELQAEASNKNHRQTELENKFESLVKESDVKTQKLDFLKNENQTLSNNLKQLQKDIVETTNKMKVKENILNLINLEEKSDSLPSNIEMNSLNVTEDLIKDQQQLLLATNPENDSSQVVREMKFHIEKLSNEFLNLQGKYFQLKNIDSISIERKSPTFSMFHPNEQNNASISKSTPQFPDKHRDNESFEIHIDKSQQTVNHDSIIIEKLNTENNDQKLKNQDLQKIFQSSLEKNHIKAEYDRLSEAHKLVNEKHEKLIKDFVELQNSSQKDDNKIDLFEERLKKLQEENNQLRSQLDQYRDTLEKTELCLQNIQTSVDQEENKWKTCLKSSEDEQERLEEKIKELLSEIDVLRNKKNSESSPVTNEEIPSIVNGGPIASETKKKKKNKNKKKKSKTRVAQQ